MKSSGNVGISSTTAIAVMVVLVIIAAAGWTSYAAFPRSGATQTITQTVQGTGTSSLVTQTVTSTSTVSVTGVSSTGGSCTVSIPQKITQISVAVPSVAATFAALEIAESLGFMREQGLNVTEHVLSSSTFTDALVANQVNFGIAPIGTIIPTYVKGETLVVLMPDYLGAQGTGVVVSQSAYNRGVTSMSQLNGLRIGSQSAPNAGFYVAQFYEKYYHINFTQVTYSSLSVGLSALQTGQIDAFVGISDSQAISFVQGANAVQILHSSSVNATVWNAILNANGYALPAGSIFINGVVATTPQMMQQNPQVVQEFVNAITEAQTWINAHDANAVLNAAYKDPTLQVSNMSQYTPDINYLKAYGNPPSGNVTTSDWQATILYEEAIGAVTTSSVPQLQSSSYNDLVNSGPWRSASWCYSLSSWGA